jgi:hypothetical protein
VAARDDLEPLVGGDFGTRPTVAARDFGERGERVEFGDGFGGGANRRREALHPDAHRFEEFAFERRRAFMGAEDPSLQRAQLRCRETLGIGECLLALEIARYTCEVRLAHLDAVAVHRVEAKLQRRDAAALALARFESREQAATLRRGLAQRIQLGVEAGTHVADLSRAAGRGSRADRRPARLRAAPAPGTGSAAAGSRTRLSPGATSVARCEAGRERRQRRQRADQPDRAARVRHASSEQAFEITHRRRARGAGRAGGRARRATRRLARADRDRISNG